MFSLIQARFPLKRVQHTGYMKKQKWLIGSAVFVALLVLFLIFSPSQEPVVVDEFVLRKGWRV